MEAFFMFIFGCLVTHAVISLTKHFSFTKRGIYKDMINSHLKAIKNSLENVTEFPYTYYVGNTNDFTIQLTDDISKKLRRKGFKVIRKEDDINCEILLIS